LVRPCSSPAGERSWQKAANTGTGNWFLPSASRTARGSGSASPSGRAPFVVKKGSHPLLKPAPGVRCCSQERLWRAEVEISRRVPHVKELSCYLIGWRAYFGFCQTPSVLRDLEQWIRRRLRAIAWRQWKQGHTRFAELRRCGVGRDLAAQTAGSPHGPWRLSNSPALTIAMSNADMRSLGLAPLIPVAALHPPNRRIRGPVCTGGVGGAEL
jgi:hypothetical protein